MVPWSITRVTDLPPNATLREMQQHALAQLIRVSHPMCHNCPNRCSMRALYHPCTSLYNCCHAVKVPFLLPMKVKAGASPCPQLQRGLSISPTGKGPVHIPNRKGASPYPQLEMGQSISPTGKGRAKSVD